MGRVDIGERMQLTPEQRAEMVKLFRVRANYYRNEIRLAELFEDLGLSVDCLKMLQANEAAADALEAQPALQDEIEQLRARVKELERLIAAIRAAEGQG